MWTKVGIVRGMKFHRFRADPPFHKDSLDGVVGFAKGAPWTLCAAIWPREGGQ